ncbi:MAG TPA: hypothetical protein VM889_02900 [Candidatus Thermoplasmatota archaeon]|nr:hypothetical protein [Candidatus Thermoplasmatota archaeon]
MRSTPVALAALLVLGSLAFAIPPGAGAGEPLAVDAGSTLRVAPGEPIPLDGRAFGGVPPLAYAWSGGEAARFSDATSPATTYATTGLVAGTLALTLTVTDANGAVASDMVLHRIDAPNVLLDVTGTILAGAPDEIIFVNSFDGRTHAFAVPAGVARLDATLDWTSGANDLDFQLARGTTTTGAAGETSSKPERITVANPASGAWTARVRPYFSGPETYRLTVTTPPTVSLPVASAAHPVGAYNYGTLDAHALFASASGGTAPYVFAWDLDGDGRLETSGANASASLPVGTHAVRVRVTDATGYRSEASAIVTVHDVHHVLVARCGNVPGAVSMMEFSASGGACFNHMGHNTYFFGDATYALRKAWGRAFAVEQQFTPPAGEDGLPDPFTTPLLVETSADGVAWSLAGTGRYVFVSTSPPGAPDRQYVEFEFEGDGRAFRFLRVRAPQSAAQGLSGFLDASGFDLYADVVATSPPALATGILERACETHVMERFFTTHPCWFGGINRYDSASFYHTYWAGDGAKLDRVRGKAILAPWRSDDFWGASLQPADARVKAFVQTSLDGRDWDTVATVEGTFGAAIPIDVLLSGKEARMVRLIPQEHERFHDWRQGWQWAPLKHFRGYFVHSTLTLEGLLPAP